MRPFRLLHLPHIPLRDILLQLNCVILAFCSNKCRLVVKLMKFKATSLSIEHTRKRQKVAICLQHFDVYWNLKSLYENKNNEQDVEEFVDNYNIQRKNFKTRKCIMHENIQFPSTPHYEFTSLCDDLQATAQLISQFVRSIFKFDSIGYILDGNSCPEWEKLILENVNNDPEPLKQRKILIAPEYPLPLSHLYGASTEQISYRNKNVTLEEIIEFFKNWIDGKVPNILHLRLMHQEFTMNRREQSMNKICEEVELLSFDSKRDSQDYMENSFTGTLGRIKLSVWDLKSNDGTMATIGVASGNLCFYVWKKLPAV